ncbi:tbc1 domain family member 14 [Ophiostoma piceae UAMH 11346]|uniref:Tbc1 domain family member 14 n=1 Tax=Ophiostoma piceae (strain UAMH 11346) TaxID=1262450 RepID=S3CD08_OPHP1|nr:tbc1 domain family member 14 [Ophiostoma piceae UAMH 11346]
MMMVYEHAIVDTVGPSPGSPPGMTASKSSKSSSFHSISSDDNSVLSDVNHFEDIGLDDDSTIIPHHDRDSDFKTVRPNRFSPSFSADLRTASIQQKAQAPRMHATRDLARTRPHTRDIITPKVRPTLHPLQVQHHTQNTQPRGSNVRSTSTSALMPDGLGPKRHRPTTSRSATSLATYRHRSPSPNTMNVPHGLKDPGVVVKPRRGSWQSTASRKSALQLEMECDEDEGDDIPEGLVLDNVPISPRPPSERSHPISPMSSKSGSPDRGSKGKDRVRSVGNGTPAIAAAQGCLRSPSWKQDEANSESISGTASPVKLRARSWTAALSDLNMEAKELTEKLEEHADELKLKNQRSSTGSLPATRRAVTSPVDAKSRHKSALPELPPLRRSNIMIDPLPVSKEKEAVLSRTRPSWLPPKDPAEEKRHLKEYQKMMAYSIEAEKRREASKQAKSECRDTAASGIMQIWEQDILPRWNDAIRERRTRDLWWRGIAPRIRGAVWTRAIGNELGLTEASFDAALSRAHEVEARAKAGTAVEGDEQHVANFASIRLDVQDRTWRDLKIFQAGAPLHQGLMDVLMAYSMYRSDIGYVTGCNTVAALLLLNLPGPASAFVALANLLNRPLPLSFYASDPGAKSSAYNLLLQTLSSKAPALFYHITNMPSHETQEFGPDYYLNDVFTSLFTGQLALDQAARLFDAYVFEGDALLVRAGVAFLIERESVLLGTKSVDEVRRAVLGSAALPDASAKQAVVAQAGEEDRWMKAVRDAGKIAK